MTTQSQLTASPQEGVGKNSGPRDQGPVTKDPLVTSVSWNFILLIHSVLAVPVQVMMINI